MHSIVIGVLLVLSISVEKDTATINSTVQQNCDYSIEVGTQICWNITEIFPEKLFYNKMFLYNTNLQCNNCSIHHFTNKTFVFDNHFNSINLSYSHIKSVGYRSMSVFRQSQYIYLDHNDIVNIEPEAFWSLEQVNEIRLDHNELSDLQLGFLNNATVRSLDLSHNRLKTISNGVFIGSRGVITLDLSHNRISMLEADGFYGLDKLEILNLEHNAICHIQLGVFKYFGNLRQLNLADNKLSRKSLRNPALFSGLNNLNSLTLANNSQIHSLDDATFLLAFDALNKLDVSGTQLLYLDAHDIHQNARSLRVIRIENNLFSCKVLTGLIRYFKHRDVEVVTLLKRYNCLNINGLACVDQDIPERVSLSTFYENAKRDGEKYANTC